MDDRRPIGLNRPSAAQRGTRGYCQSCGAQAPTKRVEFYCVMGALILVYYQWIRGQLCKSCIRRHFWEYTLTTLCFGWWSVISLLLTPFIILHNVIRYVFCLPMPRVPPIKPRDGATAPASEARNAQKPVAKRIEVIWDLPEAPVTQREASKPIPDGQAELGASADRPRE